jgi:hypothetical protein
LKGNAYDNIHIELNALSLSKKVQIIFEKNTQMCTISITLPQKNALIEIDSNNGGICYEQRLDKGFRT